MKFTHILAAAAIAVCGVAAPPPVPRTFATAVQPLLAKYCYSCHNEKLQSGSLNLAAYTSGQPVVKDRAQWEEIVRRIEAGEMPPKGLPRPSQSEVAAAADFLRAEFARADSTAKPEPGRVTARRLNRSEYNNTIRDLLAVDLNPANDFPQDDSGYGFDNIGSALSLSPVLMEKYLSAAGKVVNAAIFGPGTVKPTVVRHQPVYRPGTDGGDNSRFANILPYTIADYDVTGLALPSALHTVHTFPAEGDYIVRVDPEGERPAPSDPFTVAIWIDGKQVGRIDDFASARGRAKTGIGSLEGADRTITIHAPAGEHWLAVSALRLYEGLPAKYKGPKPNTEPEPAPKPAAAPLQPKPGATPEEIAEFEKRRAQIAANQRQNARHPSLITDVTFRVNFLEITGPFEPQQAPSPESLKKIFTCAAKDAACARKIISDFSRRAYRRPVSANEVNRLSALAADSRKRGDSFGQSIATALEAILVSPQFLFRIEHDPAPVAGDPRHAVNDFELASRLSYFLWSSMPDEELLRVAEHKSLHRPDVLSAQVKRMLKDPKSHALVSDFGGQWLQFRALESVKPDLNRFGKFDDYVRMSERRETEMFFERIMREDRPVLDFLNGKYTFLNEKLAEFYGIKGVYGPEFRKVDLTGLPRAGVLTQGSVLTASSYPTRTSVVLRGKWVLENLLNEPVPPPPPGVPLLDEATVGTSKPLRLQMEEHRANPICSSCHSRMDPIGFGLENYDAIGQWRTEDAKVAIDPSGTLPNGKKFQGPADLADALAAEPDVFAGAITEKMLTYALGRGLEPFDRPVVKSIRVKLAANDYRFSTLVLEIVKSLPFRQRRGDRSDVHNP